MYLGFFVVIYTISAFICKPCDSQRSFVVDYEKETFLKDGKPFRYVSGSIHYSRVPYYYWRDRLMKMQAAGLNAVQVYIPWNAHEGIEGVYDFKGQQNLPGFIKLAGDIGLLVILRPGPYICAEWEYGGLPAWILKNNGSIVVRTMDPGYIKPVDRWMGVLLPVIKPLLYSNGGPIIMVQVENEYGSYSGVDCGHDYMAHLRDTLHSYLGEDILLFTTDGDGEGYLKCGAINGTLATVDFGAGGNVTSSLDVMRKWNNGGPLVNSEFYTGWLDHWGGSHAHVDTAAVIKSLREMLDLGASVNMYMFEGGTNFGYTNGADPGMSICPTSYDYDAPLSEAGDVTDKYLAIRNLLTNYTVYPPLPIPPNIPSYSYGSVPMNMISTVLSSLSVISPSPPTQSVYPLSMEQIGQNYGFILYRTVIKQSLPLAELSVAGIRDRGYVLLNGVPQGVLDRKGATSFNILTRKGLNLDIIVENQGRINFGSEINGNRKGIISNVTLMGAILENWDIYPLDFEKIPLDTTLHFRSSQRSGELGKLLQPAIYSGTFSTPDKPGFPQDTYLNMCGWYKGQAFLNGFNLGRYWPSMGPQVTLYVPAGAIKPAPHSNILVLVELERAPCGVHGSSCSIELTDTPNINGKCYDKSQVFKLDPLLVTSSHRIHLRT